MQMQMQMQCNAMQGGCDPAADTLPGTYILPSLVSGLLVGYLACYVVLPGDSHLSLGGKLK